MSEEVVSMELPAPSGWKKQYFPKNRGTPRKNEIIFTSPTGEQIRNKRQLQQYLKAHPDGPQASDFDWGTGETPRRSARISEKPKDVSPAESEPPKKRVRKSSASKKDSKEDETADEETKTEEVEMKDAEKTEHEGEKNAQTQEKEPDVSKEVETENQENKDTSNEIKGSDSLDEKSEKDTSVPQAEDKDAEAKAGEQPQVPEDAKDVSQEEVKQDREEGEKEPTKIDGGETGHETDPVQIEKPEDKEQPPSDTVKENSLEEAMKSSASEMDIKENEAADEETKTRELEMKDAEKEPVQVGEKDAQIQERETDALKEVAIENREDNDTSAETKDSVSLDAKSEIQPEHGGGKDVQIQETNETEQKEQDALKEVATENQESKDKSTVMDSVFLDAKTEYTTLPQVPADTTAVSQEQVKEPTNIDQTEPIQTEKPQDKEEPTSGVVKEDGLEDAMKPDMPVDAEATVNGSDPGLVQEPKSEMDVKPVEATENRSQAV